MKRQVVVSEKAGGGYRPAEMSQVHDWVCACLK